MDLKVSDAKPSATQDQQPKDQSTFVPYPVADTPLTAKVYDILQAHYPLKNVRKGINEVIKILNKDKADFVIMAANASPPELLASIPAMCEERSVPYCFVPDAAGLGRACGIKRPVICCCVLAADSEHLKAQSNALKDKIELLFY